jgi:predicted transcriptional regulator
VRVNTVTAPSVSENVDVRQERNVSSQGSRRQRRSSLELRVGDAFNPFSLFDGALVPSEILRSPDLTPSEKLVFARLMQFAGGKGRAWPSIERVADEVALSVAQARRCIAALENNGLIRRVPRSGRSNEFEFLWHAIYEQEPRSSMIAVPRSCMSALPQSSVSGPGQSSMSAGGQSPAIGPGRSSVIARRESIESSSSEEIQIEENQSAKIPEQLALPAGLTDDYSLHRREELEDPEQEFLLRLKERHGTSVDRHAILQCVIGDLKSYSDLKPFLEFERKQTSAPHKLTNPAGHYRRAVQKFYETRAKKRDWDMREQMRALEAKIGSARDDIERPTCPLSRCNGTGEVYDSAGLVSPCECLFGQQLSPKVLALFDEVNALRKGKAAETTRKGANA